LRRRRRDERQFLGDAQAGLRDEPGDCGLAEASGVKLDSQRVRFVVEGEAADAVDVARAGKRQGDLLGKRRHKAIEDVDRGHRYRIAVRRFLRASADFKRERRLRRPPIGSSFSLTDRCA
jgi:hypothetical protein